MRAVLKKCVFSFILITSLALCPICLMACNNNPPSTDKAANFDKAISAAIDAIQQYSADSGVSSLALEFEEVDNKNLSAQLLFVDYMNETGKSDNFDFPNKAFKASLLETPEIDYSIYGIHKYTVVGNNVSAEMIFTYEIGGFDYGFDTADYEKIDIVYDFESDALVSFEWTSYLVEYDMLFHYVYEDGTLKILKETAAEEYSTFIIKTRNSAEALFNTAPLAEKTYDFKNEYREVFKKYNGVYPDEM